MYHVPASLDVANHSNIQRRETNHRRSIMHLLTQHCSNPGCLSEHVRRWARGTARTWCQLGRYAVIVICIRKVKHTMESMFKICGPSLWVCQNKIIADRNPRAKRKQQSTMGKKTLVVRKSSVLRSTPTCKPVWNFAFQAPKHFGGKLQDPRTFIRSVLKAMQVVDLFKLWSSRDVQFKTSTCWIAKLSTWGVDRVVELSVLTQNNQGWKGTQEGRLPGYSSFPILQVTHHPPCDWSKFKESTRQHMNKEQDFKGI